MGDALLSIFPVQGEAWTEAVDAGIDAARAIRAEEARRSASSGMALRSGMAMHTGELLYGNIGAPGRLDFTVLGSAVNKTARISGLCGPLGEPILLSAGGASCATTPLRQVGSHSLRGFPEPEGIFAPQ
jgi:adenylate cyclase